MPGMIFVFYQSFLSLCWKKKQSFEAVAQRCSVKKVFFEISQNPQENTFARASFLIKLQATGILRNFLENVFLQNTYGRCFWMFSHPQKACFRNPNGL